LEYLADQIYLFQGSSSNPLLNPTNFIYAMHLAGVTAPSFSDAVDEFTGALPTGLSLAAGTAYLTSSLTHHGDEDGNHSAWYLDLGSPALAQLQSQGGSKAQWLSAIGDSGHWSNAPSVSAGQLFIMTPEPSRALLLALGMGALILRRQREISLRKTIALSL
jgi:hypothetical protein